MTIKSIVTSRLAIKWAKGVLVGVVLVASIVTIYDFASYYVGGHEAKIVEEVIDGISSSVASRLSKGETDKISLAAPREVVRYGTVYRFSTSGTMGFYYYDMKKGNIVVNWQIYPWFVASIESNDDKESDNFVNYVSEHKNYVFKIFGVKEADDCDHYEDKYKGVCLEMVTVKEIIAVQKAKK